MAKRKVKRQVPADHIAASIRIVRGHSVLLDAELAELYGVETKVLIQSVKRNLERFPADFLLQLSPTEWESLRSQSVTSKVGRGGRRYAPLAFTEQGVAMLSSVLKSGRAIAVNIEIMRTFVRLRGASPSNNELTHMKRRVESHDTMIVGIMKGMSDLKNAGGTRSGGPISPDENEP